MTALAPLQRLLKRINKKVDSACGPYQVPACWINPADGFKPVEVHPYQFFADGIGRIIDSAPQPLDHAETTGGAWTRFATTYNMFVRSAAAFDHDGDGKLGRPNADGLSETGTFVKAICLLPYIKALGCNTIHLLPITAIGQDGNKGDAGSPYAIRNPYKLDKNLAEPSLKLNVDDQFAAFVAAAHHLGLRVVTEFVFRTSSKDGDAIKEHPEWFYWIDAAVKDRKPGSASEDAYGMPVFTPDEARQIIHDVESGKLEQSMPPHQVYRDMFLDVPSAENIRRNRGRWIAKYDDGRKGRIPGAFADWPVDDNQPPWGDVTYLRLYDHPDFNYIAYNTIRMYDPEFAQPQNAVEPLWEYIANIVPHYQTTFGTDGAMIDMGHALPMPLKQRIIGRARSNDPNFAFWDENFQVKQKSVDEGYNAVMGSLPFLLDLPDETIRWLEQFAADDQPLPLFGAIENHNTPRAVSKQGGEAYAKYAFAIASFLPSMPFVHNGLEFGESYPINTGLGFTSDQIAKLPSEELPLFSAVAYDWANGSLDMLAWVQRTLALRNRHSSVFTDPRSETIDLLHSDNPHIHAILRRTDNWSVKLALVFNTDMHNAQSVWMPLPTGRDQLMDHYTDAMVSTSNAWIHQHLPAGGVVWYEL